LIACFIFVAAVCARLGIWQTDRLHQRRQANAVAQAARSAPPVLVGSDSLPAIGLANRRVQVAGQFDHEHDMVLRGRAYQGVPGVEIVSPLVLRSGKAAVLVNRGFVPAPDAFTVELDSLREPGEKLVRGVALPIDSGGGVPLQHGKETTWAKLDMSALRARLPYPIASIYVVQSPDTTLPRFPRRLDPPVLDDGPHLSYAIQWFAFSIMAVVFGIVILKQKRKRGRTSVNGDEQA
jgi:surfeit locus 1 family protein